MVHLGLGSFFRAHQAWFTARATDAEGWGIAAHAGRRPELARDLTAQGGMFTLVTRGAERDVHELVGSIVRSHAAADHARWLADLAEPEVRVVTLTVTEAGWCRGPDGALDVSNPAIAADLDALRHDPIAPVSSAPARLLAGLAARRLADAGTITLVPCDNLPGNGAALREVLRRLAEVVEPRMLDWLDAQVAFASTMVDRITPATTDADRRAVEAATGWRDRAPVVTEPFAEWVVSGLRAGDHPDWASAGARLVDDVAPYEQRKLTLLNGAHSMLAYLGSVRGHDTVAAAIRDATCRGWVERWWAESAPYLDTPAIDVAHATRVLVDRFANPRIEHRLAQIAQDGSQKLPVRVLPTVRAARADGRVPEAAACTLAAWIVCLRGGGAMVVDPRTDELVALAAGSVGEATRRVLAALDDSLADDEAFVDAVEVQVEELSASRST
jgi:fructuronate reductase